MSRIPDEWLDATFYLGTKDATAETDMPRWRGTGFVLSAPNEFLSGARQLYLVTARHNIEGARNAGNLWLRVNTGAGRSVVIEADPNGPWVFHDDDTVDIAMASGAALDSLSLPFALASEQVWTDVDADGIDFGITSNLYVMGLFTSREGTEYNIPVIRTGIVAAMPGELIDDGLGHGPYRGYLAEVLSMGGLSGAPVFFHASQGTKFPRVSFYLIGLVRSHWDELPMGATADLPRRDWLNRGIAAVTPAAGILEMLETEAMKADRKRNAERVGKEQS